MKFLILDTYYPAFLKKVRIENPKLSERPYKDQLKFLLSLSFGTSDFYSNNLKKIGHEASDIIVNDEILQKQWARENGLDVKPTWLVSKFRFLPLISKIFLRPDWIQEIALGQIRKCRPDVLYVQDLSILAPSTLLKAKKYCKLLVGQIASPLPPTSNLKKFDLILTSFPHFLKKFEMMGIKSEYFKIGFEPKILAKLDQKLKRKYDITFVGGISQAHLKGLKMLNFVANRLKVDVWGYGKILLLPSSKLYQYHHGEAWALDMYKILAQSKITINRHIDVAENYANNMRLYEATGMGAMLLTEEKTNLNDLFQVGKEVVSYSSNKDLVSKLKYFLKHDRERLKIARAGQRRTLNDHTYAKRMKELVSIVSKYVFPN